MVKMMTSDEIMLIGFLLSIMYVACLC